MKKILLINKITKVDVFIQKDKVILQKKYILEHVDEMPSIKDPLNFISKLIKYYPLAKNCDYIYSWWCHSFFSGVLAKLANKRLILIAGGSDTLKDEQLKEGTFYNPIKGFLTKLNIALAYRVLVVDYSLKLQIIKNTGLSGKNIFEVPTEYNYKFWKSTIKSSRAGVIMVGTNYWIKGVDRYIELARNCPEINFILVGCTPPIDCPKNLKIIDWTSENCLRKLYNSSRIYCQLSRHEGLPNALCEAMLCECIPVGWGVNGIPKAIGKSGYIINELDYDYFKKIYYGQIKFPENPRQRIIELFGTGTRLKKLIEFIY